MQCPHCLQHFFSRAKHVDLGKFGEDHWSITLETCPNCVDAIVVISRLDSLGNRVTTMIYPKGTPRPPLSDEIPEPIAQDYREAAVLLEDGPEASAAFARRCLRGLLHHVGFKDESLNREIDTLIGTKHVPRFLSEWLDNMREIGKFPDYPAKSTNPGEIQPALPGEAECLLDALDGLFEFFFVQPAAMAKKRDELLAKLDIAWKNAL